MTSVAKKLLAGLIFGVSCVGISVNVLANDDQRQLPNLIEHSKTTFTVFQGDKVKLEVQAEGKNLLYRWVRNHKTICRNAECAFDSAAWGVGKQSLTMVVYNQHGSRSITYLIRVLARPSDRSVQDISPELVTAGNTETVANSDFYIKAITGIGYAYKSNDVKVIGEVPRLLSWDEKIRTHVKGVLHFGVKNEKEMILLPAGQVVLARSATGRRAIILRRGILRARQISVDAPQWSALVDDWIQVDVDQTGDVIIERKNATQAAVTVVRGNARVFFRKTIDQPLNEGKALTIPVGVTVEFEQGYEPSEFRSPDFKYIDKLLRRSSPQYFLNAKGKSTNRKGAFVQPALFERTGRPVPDALNAAEKNIVQEDYVLALEHLLPSLEKGRENFRFNMTLANAYRGLNLIRPAMAFYSQASKIDHEHPDPEFATGLMYINAGAWNKAETHLSLARRKKYKNKQLVNYYLGVAQFNQKKTRDAKFAFEQALWHAPNADIKQSTYAFLAKLGTNQTVGAHGSLGLGYDSNVYRWGKGSRLASYETDSGVYYEGFGSLFYRPFNDSEGFVTLAFDVRKKGFFNAKLAEIETLNQRLYLDWATHFGVDENYKSHVTLRLMPFVELLSFGEERSADMYGLVTEIGSQTVRWKPKLLFDYMFLLDPLPGRDDLLDPVLYEPVHPSDRSAVVTSYGVAATVLEQPSYDIGIKALYKTVERRSKMIRIDDFNEISLHVPMHAALGPDCTLTLGPGYFTRTFPNAKESRSDTGYFADLSMTYYYIYSFSNELNLHYRKQASDQDLAEYNQYKALLNFSLHL